VPARVFVSRLPGPLHFLRCPGARNLLFAATGCSLSPLLISVAFGAVHLPNPGENALGILQVVEFGLLMCLTLRRTGNVWFAVGFHAARDWAETYFYGTPNSGLLGAGRFLSTSVRGPNWLTGGSAGPEGSVITLLTLVLRALAIHFRFPRAVYPDCPV
jgi:membrane protease YdiL (CAAX protease family)